MSIPRLGCRAAALAVALVASLSARAETADRSGAVIAARLDLQRQLGDLLTRSLAGPAEPFKVEATVRVDLRGHMREIREKHENSPAVKIGGTNKVKLPGLGMVDGGGQAGLVPEINIEGRAVEQVTRQLETEVAQMTIMLFVDPAMPKERRELLVKLAGELASVDKSRGDEIVVQERPSLGAGAPGTPGSINIAATVQPATKVPWDVVAICATALAAAAIIAFGLTRRPGMAAGGGGFGGLGGRAGGDGGGGVGGAGGAGGAVIAAQVMEAEARRRRKEIGAFAALADATAAEIVQVVAECDAATATAIVDLFGLDPEMAKLVEATVPRQRQLEIGVTLATARILTREQLGQLEASAEATLQRIRNRVPIGGPSRLAGFLAQAPASARSEILEGVAARDERAAQEARSAMLLFEDLPRLSDASVRQVVTGIDPAVVALAIVGAPEVRDVVLGAVSKRLRGILESEGEIVQNKPSSEIEDARRVLEEAMRQASDRGEIRTREAQAA